jgi:hypothetical protein
MARWPLLVFVLVALACGPASEPPQSPATASPSQTETPRSKTPSSPSAPPDGPEDPPFASGGSWTACMIAKADLEAETGEPSAIAPPGGQLLALDYDLVQGNVHTILLVTVGLAAVPIAGRTMDVKGFVRHRMMEPEGAIEAGDAIEGTIAGDPAKLEVTLQAKDMFRRMFKSDTSINHFTVNVKRIHKTKECTR